MHLQPAKNAPKSAATTDGQVTHRIRGDRDQAGRQSRRRPTRPHWSEQIANQLRTDVVAEYVIALRERLGVSINQRLLDQTIGIAPRDQVATTRV